MRILVTGGLGYIGSHVVVALVKEGYDVMVVDSLINSKMQVVGSIESLTGRELEYFIDNCADIKYFYFDVVMHFAALKSVPQSFEIPSQYYYNNLVPLLELSHIPNIIFSSSCAAENPQSPYGWSKLMGEQIIKDCYKNSTILRYHNPVGNTPTLPSSNIGLMNNLDNCKGTIDVFGNDYPTKDGTCERDFINIHDVVDAHLLALQNIGGKKLYTIGRGEAVSVKEFVGIYNKAFDKKIKIKYVGRREGDIVSSKADCSLIYNELGWKAKRKLFDRA